MSGLRQILLVASRDFIQRAKSRVFVVSMAVIVVVIVGLGLLLASESRRATPTYRVGVVGDVPVGFEKALGDAARSFDRRVRITDYSESAKAELALRKGRLDVAIVGGRTLMWKEAEDPQLAAIVSTAVQGLARARAIERLGLTSEQIASLLVPEPLGKRILKEPDEERTPRIVAATVSAVILYVSVLIFGQFVLLGVMEEKSSRVVEVILSRVRSRHLLAGKVTGIGVLGLVQMVIVGAVAWAVMRGVHIKGVDLSGITGRTALTMVTWYLMAYAFYSVLNAMLGATITRQEDVQGVAMIPALLLLPGYFVAMTAAASPGSSLARVFSLLPPSAPMVMPVRMAMGKVPAWEVVVAVGLLLASIYGLVRLAGHIYEGAILRVGRRVRLRDAWRAV